MAAARLQDLSEGRFALGLGPLPDGNGPFSAVTAAERLIEEASALVTPLPIVVAGDGAGPYRLAAEWATDWLTVATPEQFTRRRDQLREVCRSTGRESPLATAVARPEYLGETHYEAPGEIVTCLRGTLRSAVEATAWLGWAAA